MKTSQDKRGIMAEFNFHDLKKTISKKANEVNVKTSTFIEISKIKSYISAINQETERKYCEIGKNLYQMWKDQSVNLEELENLFTEINDCEVKIQEYSLQIQKIEEDNKKYMGVANENMIFCSNCGAKNSTEALFCRECGNKME